MLPSNVQEEDKVIIYYYLTDSLVISLEGADVEIVESFINFGNIACGTNTAHVLHIKNNSQNVKGVYQVNNNILCVNDLLTLWGCQ